MQLRLGRTLKIKSDCDPVTKNSKELKSTLAVEKKSEEAIAAADDKDKNNEQSSRICCSGRRQFRKHC